MKTATFPERANANTAVVVLHANGDGDNITVLTPYTEYVTNTLMNELPKFYIPNVFVSITGYYTYNGTSVNDHSSEPVNPLARQFVTPDNKSTILPVSYTNVQLIDFTTINLFTRYLQDIIDNLDVDSSINAITVGATGQDMLFDDTQRESEADFINMDSIVLPGSMFVLALYLRNLRLMIIPILCTACSLLVSFTIMWVVANYIVVASFAPSVMVSIIIAMSIDYSLFLLTRFREEILRGANVIVAVRHMTRYAGHVVLLSGSTLTITFLGLIFLKLNILQSIGIACALALIISLIVNLTLTPALLLTFGDFFSQFRLLPRRWYKVLDRVWNKITHMFSKQKDDKTTIKHNNSDQQDLIQPLLYNGNSDSDYSNGYNTPKNKQLNGRNHNNNNTSLNQTNTNGNGTSNGNGNGIHYDENNNTDRILNITDNQQQTTLLHYPADSDDDSPERRQDKQNQREYMIRSRIASRIDELESKALNEQNASLWYKTAVIATGTKMSILIIILVIGLIMSVAWKVIQFQTTPDNVLVFPANSRSLDVFRNMQKYFPPGTVDPYNIIVTTHIQDNVLSQEFYDSQVELANQLVDTGLVLNTSIASIAYMHGVAIDYTIAQDIMNNDDQSILPVTYRTLFNQLVNANRTAALMIVITSIDPNGYGTTQWIDHVRSLLKQQQDNNIYNYQYYLAGGATYNLDIMRSINQSVPILVGVTASVLLIIVGYIFKSVLVPIRQLFTIGLSICFVYGLAAFVFQDLNYKNAHAIYWMELVMTFSLLVGLGLDYDVFLFSRVMEYRKLGYTNRASITKAIYRTGPIITAAGLIMALAFGGLMLSQTIVMIQFGFMLCFAVLLDTFIVRTLLVPSLLAVSGNLNWWPQTMIQEQYNAEHFRFEEIETDFYNMNNSNNINLSPSQSPEPGQFNGMQYTIGVAHT